MPPRYVLAGHRNLLFYLFIWLSFTISNWKTAQLDYDVPTTSPEKSNPSDLEEQFDSKIDKNDKYSIDGLKKHKQDTHNTKNKGTELPNQDSSEKKHTNKRKPSNYRASTASSTSPFDFLYTTISGQSIEEGNNQSLENHNSSSTLQSNTTGYVESSIEPDIQGRNLSENLFHEINKTSGTQSLTNRSINYTGSNNDTVTDHLNGYNITEFNVSNYTGYDNRSLSQNITSGLLNETVYSAEYNNSLYDGVNNETNNISYSNNSTSNEIVIGNETIAANNSINDTNGVEVPIGIGNKTTSNVIIVKDHDENITSTNNTTISEISLKNETINNWNLTKNDSETDSLIDYNSNRTNDNENNTRTNKTTLEHDEITVLVNATNITTPSAEMYNNETFSNETDRNVTTNSESFSSGTINNETLLNSTTSNVTTSDNTSIINDWNESFKNITNNETLLNSTTSNVTTSDNTSIINDWNEIFENVTTNGTEILVNVTRDENYSPKPIGSKENEAANFTSKSPSLETTTLKITDNEHSTIKYKSTSNIYYDVKAESTVTDDQNKDSHSVSAPTTTQNSQIPTGRSTKNILTTLFSTTENGITSQPMNVHRDIEPKAEDTTTQENKFSTYRSTTSWNKEIEFTHATATAETNKQQASNRLKPTQPGSKGFETTQKPDLYSTQTDINNILSTSDISTARNSISKNKEYWVTAQSQQTESITETISKLPFTNEKNKISTTQPKSKLIESTQPENSQIQSTQKETIGNLEEVVGTTQRKHLQENKDDLTTNTPETTHYPEVPVLNKPTTQMPTSYNPTREPTSKTTPIKLLIKTTTPEHRIGTTSKDEINTTSKDEINTTSKDEINTTSKDEINTTPESQQVTTPESQTSATSAGNQKATSSEHQLDTTPESQKATTAEYQKVITAEYRRYTTSEYRRDTTPEYRKDTTPEYQKDTTPEYQKDTTPEYQKDTTSEYWRDTTPEYRRDTTPEYRRDTTPEYRRDTTPEYRRDTTPEYHKDTTPENLRYTTPEYRKDTTPEYRRDTTPEYRRDTTPEYRRDTTPEYRRDTTPEYHKDTTPENQRYTTPEYRKDTTPEYRRDTTPEYHKNTTPEYRKDTTPEYRKDTTSEYHKDTTPEHQKVTTPEYQKVTTPEYQKVTTPEYQKVTTPEYQKLTTLDSKTSTRLEYQKSVTITQEDTSTPKLLKLQSPTVMPTAKTTKMSLLMQTATSEHQKSATIDTKEDNSQPELPKPKSKSKRAPVSSPMEEVSESSQTITSNIDLDVEVSTEQTTTESKPEITLSQSTSKAQFRPKVKSLSANEIKEKYRDTDTGQPKRVREKTMEEMKNTLIELCQTLTPAHDVRTVAIEDISFTARLTQVAGNQNEFFDICPLANDTVKEIENKFSIGPELEAKYKNWECVKGEKCDDLCFGVSHLISHYVLDIFIKTESKRKQAYRSTIVNVLLINPKKWTVIPETRLSKPVEYKFQLYTDDTYQNFEIACCVWEHNVWNKSACQTIELNDNEIHCACNTLGYTTAFLIQNDVPTTTTEIPTTVESVTLSPDLKEKLSNLNKKQTRSLVNYRFEIAADYNQTVGNKKIETEESFKAQIADQLNIKKESIQRVIIAPECDDCDLTNESTVQNFTHKVRNLVPGSIKVVVQVTVSSSNNISAEEVHKHLQEKINNKELILKDKDNKELSIDPNQNVGIEIEALDVEDTSMTTAIILGVVLAVLIFFLILLAIAVYKKMKKGREKILPFNKKLTPYLNPTYKNFHHENTLDGTIESLVQIRRRSDFLYGFDEASWKSDKGGMKSHIIKPASQSWNSTIRRHSQPPSLSNTVVSKRLSMGNRTVSPPGYINDISV